MKKLYPYVFQSLEDKYVINIDNINLEKSVCVNSKFVELKMPSGGRVVLKKTLHRELAVKLRDKIVASGEEVNVDDLYNSVKKDNVKKYMLHKGRVSSAGNRSEKSIYSDGNKFYYRNKNEEKWNEIKSVGDREYE